MHKSKRLLIFILIALMLTMSVILIGCDKNESKNEEKPQDIIETFKYDLSSNGYYVSELLDAKATDIVIPSKYNDINVVGIKNNVFDGCKNIKNVTIPNGVTEIGDSAFKDCKQLSKINIPETVTKIGNYAFKGCSALTSIYLPNSLTSLGIGAFERCSNLAEIKISENVAVIKSNTFYECYSLEEIVLSNNVSVIENSAFYECRGLSSLTLGNGIAKIGNYAFSGCSRLTKITIPETVGQIDSRAFERCSKLNGIYITNLQAWFNIYFQDSLSNPLYYAGKLYLNNQVISDLIVPDSVKVIKNNTFVGCSALKSVTLHENITEIGESAFYFCSGLTDLTLPNSVVTLGDFAFRDCSGLTSVVIGNKLQSIGMQAFYVCTRLIDLTISDSVVSIGESAFGLCRSLVTLEIPNGVTQIGARAFEYCNSLEQVKISDSVNFIGDYAFEQCSELRAVLINDLEAWCNIDFGANRSNPLCYANKLFLNYTMVSNLVIPEAITQIKNNAFEGCSWFNSITFHNNVVSVGQKAFEQCTNLKKVCIKDLEAWCNIDFGANHTNPLYYAHNLYLDETLITELVIPETITQIKNYTFEGGSEFISVTIHENVVSIGQNSFEQCTKLERVCINDLEAWCNIDFGTNSSNPLYYAHRLFLNEALITELVIPEGITQIKNNTFVGGSEFVSLTMHENVISIGQNAFDGFSKLTSIIFGGSMDDWKTVTKEVAWIDTGEFIVECTDGTLNKAGEIVEEKEIN